MSRPEADTPTWRDVAIIVALGALVLVPSLFTRDPWNPDEPRYAEVARAMVATGNYLVPHLNGEVYPDKPALFFWMSAGLMRLGVGIGSGRVIAAAFSTCTLLLVYALGRRLYDRNVGLLAAAITATTLLFAWICKYGVLDPPLTTCVVAAIVCGERALGGAGRRRGLWWLGFYAAMGLGVLFKGPVALALPVLVMLAYGVARRKEANKGGWWHLAGAGMFVAVVAAGMAPSLIAGGRAYANEIVFGQTLVRFTRRASHAKPFFFFLVSWPFYLLPWSLLFPLGLAAAIKAARNEGEHRTWLPVLWVLVIFVFFSIPTGKRERYILSVVPAVALLVARYVVAVAEWGVSRPNWHKWLWRATAAVGVFGAVALVVSAFGSPAIAQRLKFEPSVVFELRALFRPATVVVAVAYSIALIVAIAYAARTMHGHRTETQRALLVVLATVAFSLVTDIAALPVINRFKSGRNLVEQGRAYIEAADDVCLYRDEFSGVYNLFSQRTRLPVLEEAEHLTAALGSHRRVAVIGKEGSFHKYPPAAPFHTVVVERVGSRRMAIVINWQPAHSTPQPQ